MGALSGLRVADLTLFLAGPYGSMMLADMGAEVIKIERPKVGDTARILQQSEPKYCYQGMSSYYLTSGRNKKSMTLDLRNEKGEEVFYDLVKVSDVVYDNFRPGVLERLRADYETLKKVNPRIISCSVSGYGLTGPAKDRPAFDGVIQAYGGEMSITGEPGRPPVRSGLAIGDIAGGVYSVVGILAALYARQTSGVGQKVDISMLDCQVSLWNYMATMYLMSGEMHVPWGSRHYVHAPYGAYKTKDIYIFLAIIGDAHWPLLVDALGIEELENEKYKKRVGRWEDKEKIDAILGEVFQTKGGDKWVKILTEKGIPCAPVNAIDRVCSDSQVLSRNMIVEVEFPDGHKIKEPGNPIKLSETPGEIFAPPPLLGQHTREVLTDILKYTDEKIDELEKEGVI
jgi:CoA:oxalate CoA-transferase